MEIRCDGSGTKNTGRRIYGMVFFGLGKSLTNKRTENMTSGGFRTAVPKPLHHPFTAFTEPF
jgi:hypothetical protein